MNKSCTFLSVCVFVTGVLHLYACVGCCGRVGKALAVFLALRSTDSVWWWEEASQADVVEL